MDTKKITSDFALLDVKGGREDLYVHFAGKRPRMGVCPEELRVPVVIHGYIDDIAGNDDGVSREFTVQVEKLEFPGK